MVGKRKGENGEVRQEGILPLEKHVAQVVPLFLGRIAFCTPEMTILIYSFSFNGFAFKSGVNCKLQLDAYNCGRVCRVLVRKIVEKF
jgi:hypothetical protein